MRAGRTNRGLNTAFHKRWQLIWVYMGRKFLFWHTNVGFKDSFSPYFDQWVMFLANLGSFKFWFKVHFRVIAGSQRKKVYIFFSFHVLLANKIWIIPYLIYQPFWGLPSRESISRQITRSITNLLWLTHLG